MIVHELLADTAHDVIDPQSCSRLRLAEQHHRRSSHPPLTNDDTPYITMSISVNTSIKVLHFIQVERHVSASLSINATLSDAVHAWVRYMMFDQPRTSITVLARDIWPPRGFSKVLSINTKLPVSTKWCHRPTHWN
jgi:hypothetical protein